MRTFAQLLAIAETHKGSAGAVADQLPAISTQSELRALSDDRYLSHMTRRIFRAGLKHSVVDARWPAFEEVFWGFDPARLELLSDEQLERLAGKPPCADVNPDECVSHGAALAGVFRHRPNHVALRAKREAMANREAAAAAATETPA